MFFVVSQTSVSIRIGSEFCWLLVLLEPHPGFHTQTFVLCLPRCKNKNKQKQSTFQPGHLSYHWPFPYLYCQYLSHHPIFTIVCSFMSLSLSAISALQHAGKHMEDSIVASYTALLLGCLCQESPVSHQASQPHPLVPLQLGKVCFGAFPTHSLGCFIYKHVIQTVEVQHFNSSSVNILDQ